jgi:hypothetical protein
VKKVSDSLHPLGVYREVQFVKDFSRAEPIRTKIVGSRESVTVWI